MKNKRLKVLSNKEILARPYRSYTFEAHIVKSVAEAYGIPTYMLTRPIPRPMIVEDVRKRLERLVRSGASVPDMVKGLSKVARFGAPIISASNFLRKYTT